MKRYLLGPLLLLFLWSNGYAQTGYSIDLLIEDTNPASDSLIYCLKDPFGTPLNRKCEVGNLIKGMDHANLGAGKGTYNHTQIDNHILTDHLFQSELLDQDDMYDDDATKPPSQQSVKAYVDGWYDILAALVNSIADTLALLQSDLVNLDATVQNQVDNNKSAENKCSGTSTYLDGEGNCDDTSDFVISCGDGQTIPCGVDGYDLTNGFMVEVSSGTISAPNVAQGIYGCVKSKTAATIYVDLSGNDRFILDGVALSDGDKLASSGAIDDTICFYADSTDGYTTLCNPDGWTDGN